MKGRAAQLKVVHVSRSDRDGGAARAALRLHEGLMKSGVDSRVTVSQKLGDAPGVDGPASHVDRGLALVRPRLGQWALRLQNAPNEGLRSINVLPSRVGRELGATDADLINLHWVCGETLSIAEIGRLPKPVVWTMHDMWPFCGAEHYCDDGPLARFRAGYSAANRPAAHSGIDLDRWTWLRKRRHWRKPMALVAPSRWMRDCAAASVLFKGWTIEKIANPLDLDFWKPVEKGTAKKLLGFDPDKPLVMFSAYGGTADRRKGGDLLLELAKELRGVYQMAVLGQSANHVSEAAVRFIGTLQDDLSLKIAYSAADAVVVPSRQDNLPNVAVEALACGTPCVAFDTGGLRDIIDHEANGYLARPFDVKDLRDGVVFVLAESRRQQLRAAARRKAESDFDGLRLAQQYVEFYQRVIQDQTARSAP